MMFNLCEAIARAAKDARTIGAGYLKVTVDGDQLTIAHLPCNAVEHTFDFKLDSFAKPPADNCPRPECADPRGQSQLKINESGRIVECRACEGHGTLRYTDTYGPCQRCQPQSYAAWCADGRPKPTTKTSIATQVMTRARARERYPDHHAEIDAVGCAPHDPLAGIPSTVPQATQESPLLSKVLEKAKALVDAIDRSDPGAVRVSVRVFSDDLKVALARLPKG